MGSVVLKKEKNVSIRGKKYKINLSRFILFIIVIIVIIFVILNLVGVFNPKIDSTTDLSKVNANKYSEQILIQYEKDGMKENFLEYYNKLQTAIGMYILSNSTLDSNSFSNISNTLNDDLKKEEYSTLGVEKSTVWNGYFSIDSNGIVKFKFKNKEIEPSWIIDSDLQSKIILN